jgi:alpha-glucosidase
MIYKKRYGQPFDTESVVGSFLPMMETIPYLTKEPDGFSYAMEPQDTLYGLGENVRGINKRGWVYESKCSDDGNHTEGKSSLYGAYNFMIVSGKDTFGFFIDYPGKTSPICSTRKPALGLAVNIKFCWIRGSRASGMI